MHITSSGQVGIGALPSIAPNSKLTVDGTISGTELLAEGTISGTALAVTGTLDAPSGWHQLHWDIEKDETGLGWASKPAALTPFRAQSNHDWNQIDLFTFREWRIVTVIISTTTPAGSEIGIQYSTDGGTNWNGLDNGTASVNSTVTAADNVTGLIVTSWTALAPGAMADVVLRCVGENGDGATDVTYGHTQVQFRS